jgi:hypothetical protein
MMQMKYNLISSRKISKRSTMPSIWGSLERRQGLKEKAYQVACPRISFQLPRTSLKVEPNLIF